MSFTNANRFSTYSASTATPPNRPSQHQPSQVSTQTLLNALHSAYTSGQPYALESSTSLVVNTWRSAVPGPEGRSACLVDGELANRAWEHARRRAEDGCIVLASLHHAAPSTLAPFISALPLSVPSSVYSALAAVQPFLHCSTPFNPATGKHSALAVSFTLSLTGTVSGAALKLSTSGIDTTSGLLSLPREQGYRAFDVFYYLLSSASSKTEREFLDLKSASSYELLKYSRTYSPPSFLPTADDAAAAEEFRASLKAIGVAGKDRRDLLSVLAALLKIGDTATDLASEDFIDTTCEEAADLLGVDPEVLARHCNGSDRMLLIGAIYEALVDWILVKANRAIAHEISHGKRVSSNDSESRAGAMTPASDEDGDTCSITIVETPIPALGKAIALKNVFDDSEGINAEMKQDGVSFPSAGHSVVQEMQSAVLRCETDLGVLSGSAGRELELQRDRRQQTLEKIGTDLEDDGILQTLLYPVSGQGISLGTHGRFDLADLLGSSRVWFHLSLHPTDDAIDKMPDMPWSASSLSSQLRDWRLPEWANRRNKQLDYTADFDYDEFSSRYSRLGCLEGRDGIESFILQRGWSNGEVVLGMDRVWVREGVWWEAETMLDMLPAPQDPMQAPSQTLGQLPMGEKYQMHPDAQGSGFFQSPFGDNMTISQENIVLAPSVARPRSLAPTQAMTMRTVSGGDYGLGHKGDAKQGALSYYNEMDPELGENKQVQEVTTSRGRRIWVAIVWALTFWIPSPLLRVVGRMKRPDVRMAWREKLVLVFFIFMINAILVFYIVEFGQLLCPNQDKAWNPDQLSTHQGLDDFYVSVYGRVYDISKFWRLDHSSGQGNTPPVNQAEMLPTAGQVCNQMFELPLETYCSPLVAPNSRIELEYNTTSALSQVFNHKSGIITTYSQSALANSYWYRETFLQRMSDYYKGDLVYDPKNISRDGSDNQHMWFIIKDQVYDLTDYFYTKSRQLNNPLYSFLDTRLEQMVQNNPGGDLTDDYANWYADNRDAAQTNFDCLNNVFYLGRTDFRLTPRCQVNNYILLAFTCILAAVIVVKFLAALQFGSKRRPAPQDKFVICQVPAYTEGEDDLRKGLDSLTALAYDNKRKLLCVMCDGMIVGGGNDRPTPKIVLDILGVDPKIDPPALPFKSVGQGSEQLNYGKVYSGLYEFEGNVVPYIVIVKVGKESEQNKAKPGNRGKRDSQVMLMSFLNRVHHRSPMSPLELEIFHQINNIIGVDPELYEYLFMVDADTMVKEDALTRLVASCADDSKIAGICGETSLRNEERSWTTMIQVYEYYISHHLAKAFESLFGSVTCLPGCFCMYRLRTADKGKPLIISDKVINEYADCNIDTLHKKNLLSLGEDRYLTTLMTKHFPFMRYKFVPDAYAQTAAPESWDVLLSQRRRWINSTIHNLAELVWIKDMCGFCCFSMRFVVFVDLFGTIILPATCVYLVYLIVHTALGKAQFPLISIIILAAVYGLQAIIFIVKRQWQHIGWMIIYILAFPIYSLILPIYSFWKQDDFSWGNTRIVIGEKGNKQLVAVDDEGFDPRSIPMQTWDDYAMQNNLPGRRGGGASEKGGYGYEDGYEMDDMRSVYSAAKPASAIVTGFKSQQPGQFYQSPVSPGPNMRQSGLRQSQSQSNFNFPYRDASPTARDSQSRLMSMGNMSEQAFYQQQQRQSPYPQSHSPAFRSSDNLMRQSDTPTPLNRAGRQSPMPLLQSRPASTINFQISAGHEPSDAAITEAIQACLAVVDLDTVTKKSLKALVEQRLQVQLSPERRVFLDHQIDVELASL